MQNQNFARQQALADQILQSAASRVQETSRNASSRGVMQLQPQQPHSASQASDGLSLTEVRTMEDARKLARQIVLNKGVDLSCLTGDTGMQAKSLLTEIQQQPSQPHSQVQQGHGILNHASAATTPLPFDDSLPDTGSVRQALREGSDAIGGKDVAALLHAVQHAVSERSRVAPAPPTPTQPLPDSVPAVNSILAPLAPLASAAYQPATTTTNPNEVQVQLQQQQHQLSLLSQLQQQLMTQQLKQAGQAGAPVSHIDRLTNPERSVSPSRQFRTPIKPSPVPVPQPVYSGGHAEPDPFSPENPHIVAALEWERSRGVPAPMPSHMMPIYNAPLASPAPPPPRMQTSPPPPPPPVALVPFQEDPLMHQMVPARAPPGPLVPVNDALQQFASMGSTVVSESPEELEAREQAHRIMVDFIAQKNLTNLLTEKLAEKTHEADNLRARLATGEGRDGVMQLTEQLGQYEQELNAERTRTLSLEHELHRLRASFEGSGLPLPKAKNDYEDEISNLRRKIEMQDRMIEEIKGRAERERQDLALQVEGKLVGSRTGASDEMLREIDALKAKLKEKKTINQELQDMLKLHLRYNAEIRTKSMVNQPQWVHPLLKDPIPTVPEVVDPTSRVDL